MENFTNHEYIFSNEIAMMGYKIYYNDETMKHDFLLIETMLTDVILVRTEFSYSEMELIFR